MQLSTQICKKTYIIITYTYIKNDIISYKSASVQYLGIYQFKFCLAVAKYISENWIVSVESVAAH